MYVLIIITLVCVIFLLSVLLFSSTTQPHQQTPQTNACPPCNHNVTKSTATSSKQYTPIDPVLNRDVRVLKDELYPPYNRPSTDVSRRYMNEPNLNPIPTRYGSSDTYRIVGYLVSEEDKNDVWKLYAREKYRGSTSEFYASPANKNFDMKVVLNNDSVIGPNRLKDLYDMPDELMVNHPMFSKSAYRVVSLSTSDFSSSYF